MIFKIGSLKCQMLRVAGHISKNYFCTAPVFSRFLKGLYTVHFLHLCIGPVVTINLFHQMRSLTLYMGFFISTPKFFYVIYFWGD